MKFKFIVRSYIGTILFALLISLPLTLYKLDDGTCTVNDFPCSVVQNLLVKFTLTASLAIGVTVILNTALLPLNLLFEGDRLKESV